MGSTSKRRQTMAKLNRERALREKRERKKERQDLKKQERLAEEIVSERGLPPQDDSPELVEED